MAREWVVVVQTNRSEYGGIEEAEGKSSSHDTP